MKNNIESKETKNTQPITEFKTTEEYIINKLVTLENENARIIQENQKLVEVYTNVIADFTDIFENVKKDLEVCYLSNYNTAYIDFKTVFENTNAEKFKWYIETFGLKNPKIEKN